MNEIFAYIIIVVAALMALVIVTLNFQKQLSAKDALIMQSELLKQRQSIFIPHKMEAYQRVILYLERIHPSSLSFRLNNPSLNAHGLQTLMLKSIREEYDHNLGQQMFISSNAWQLVNTAKEETVKLINIVSGQLHDNASSLEFATHLITATAEVKPLPSEIAIEALKAEFQRLM